MRAFVLILVTGLSFMASSAFAQRTAYQAEGEIERLLSDAQSYYDNLELELAEDALEKAIRLGKKFNVRNRTFADVYIQRGILLFVRDKEANADIAVADFSEALRIDSRVRLDPLVSTPSLERLFRDAQERSARGGRRDAARGRRDVDRGRRDAARGRRDADRGRRGPRQGQITHRKIEKARGGRKLPIEIELDDELNNSVFRVYLFFRSVRAESTQRLEMLPDGDKAFKAEIPGRFVAGRRLNYYVIAESRKGKALGSVGSAQNPRVVEVSGGTLEGLDSIPSGDSLDGLDGDEDSSGRKYVTFIVSAGSGAGFVSEFAKPERQVNIDVSPGLALAPFHTQIELDFWATEWLALGAYARIQIIEFAHLEGGRVKFKVTNADPHGLIVRVGGGVGHVRHLVPLGKVLDTTLEGPYHYTLGASYTYAFNPTVALVVSPDFIHLIGDSPSQHLDLNVGVQVGF